MIKDTRFSLEVRQRAARTVLESQDEYDSQWVTIYPTTPKVGCTSETLCARVCQHERDTGGGDGKLTAAEHRRLKGLEHENRELRHSSDILRQASAYSAKAEFDHLWKKQCHCWISCVSSTGSDRYAVNSILPRQCITIVGSSSIIPINVVPVVSATTG